MKRIEMIVSVDLDPVPGVMHTEDSARATVEEVLKDRLYQYFPMVHEEKED